VLRPILAISCLLLALPVSAQVPDLCASPSIRSVQNGPWSSSSTWSPARVPTLSDTVELRHQVTISGSIEAGCLANRGQLSVSRTQDSRLLIGTQLVDLFGYFDLGTVLDPIPPSVSVEYVIADLPLDLASDPEQFGGGILVRGQFTGHGAAKVPWMRLSGELSASAAVLPIPGAPGGWLAGDRLVIPDSRQKEPPYLPSFVTYSGGTSISAVPLAHKGVRDLTGTIRYLPHVGNLSRNVVIRSQNPSGIRGHVLATEFAQVDLRYLRLADLGRTKWETSLDSTAFDAFGNLLKIGTNQIGRYGIHLHHLDTKATLLGLAIERVTKWGVAIHDSHFSSLTDSVIVDAGGASVMTEDGSETGNVIARNLIVLSKGTGSPDSAGRGFKEFGFEGSCIWLAGPFNLVRDNVCANAWALGYTVMPFAPALVDTPNGKRNVNAFPLVEFARNEVYASYYGGQFWDVGARSADYSFTVPGESVVKDLVGWHLAKRGIYHYPTNRLTYDGLVLLNDPAMVWTNPVGLDFGDYSQRNVTIKNSELSGFRTCVAIPNKMGDVRDPYGKTATPMRIEDSQLDCQNGAISGTQWGVVGGGAYLAPRTVVVRNVRFPQRMPGVNFTLGFSTASERVIRDSSGPRFNVIVPDAMFVEAYDGNVGDDFQLFQDGQAPLRTIFQSFNGHVGSPEPNLTNLDNWSRFRIAIAGGIAPCGAQRFRIFGFTCGGSAAPPPPPAEVCGNGLDDDGDGLIDEGCEAVPPPPPSPPPPSPPVCGDAGTLYELLINGSAASVTLASGTAYTLTGRVDGRICHQVKLDGVLWTNASGSFPWSCNADDSVCTKTLNKTATATTIHALTNGGTSATRTVTMTVSNPAPSPVSQWSAPIYLTSDNAAGFGAGADGSTAVFAQTGVTTRRSVDHGSTWTSATATVSGWQGAGEIKPEKAVSVGGSVVVVVGQRTTLQTFTDFCCTRRAGDLTAWVSTNSGESYTTHFVTEGHLAHRWSVVVDPVTLDVHVRWMVGRLQGGTTGSYSPFVTYGPYVSADVWGAHKLASSASFTAPYLIASGVNAVGAGRPTVAAYNGRVFDAWMAAGFGKGTCAIEGGITLPDCTEIVGRVSNDRGQTFGLAVRLTNAPAYAGRPSAVVMRTGRIVVGFDRRDPGSQNDIGVLSSADGTGWTFTLIDPAPGESSHAVFAEGPDGRIYAAFQDQRWSSGVTRLAASSSPTGAAWDPVVQLSTTATPAPHLASTAQCVLVFSTDGTPGRAYLKRFCPGQ
jgi:hypothetical protein